MTQDALARAASISPSQVYRLEIGEREPRLTTILRLACALDLQGADLIRDLG